MPSISFVIPCSCSEKNLRFVVDEIRTAVCQRSGFSYEIVLVNDNSADGTKELISELSEEYPNIVGINFMKNFGQHAALMAGFRASRGDFVVTCDDDGQTPINRMWEFYDKLEEGYEIVCAKYKSRPQKSISRRIGTGVNEYMLKSLMGKPDDIYMSSFFIATRSMIDEIIRYNGPYPYLAGLILRSTAKIANVEVEQCERKSGSSGYRISKLFKLWINGFTAFSVKPLRISFILGLLSSAAGLVYLIVLGIIKLVDPSKVLGLYCLTAIILLLFGAVLFSLGLIGEYVGRIYLTINNTPQYVISNTSRKRVKDEE